MTRVVAPEPRSDDGPEAPLRPQTLADFVGQAQACANLKVFIEAARALGVSTWRILFIHILQNIASPILVQATFIFAYAVLAEAGLSFLGVGVPPELPTWGTMIASGQQFAHQALWIVVFPGIAIILAALSLQMVGDGFRDLLDPRLRKAI